MGRLTDNLLVILGVKPSDRVSVSKTSALSTQTESAQSSNFTTEVTSLGADVNSDAIQAEEDCLACKVTGVTTLSLGSVYVLYYSFKNAKFLPGFKRVVGYGFGISLGSLMMLLAGCHAFDMGPFDPLSVNKTMGERLEEDFIYFKNLAKMYGAGKNKDENN